ncbi:MAG TPA: bifunctional DNA-formamidopyrimidine glycosylase/DNA-(apurinic or apyrimidinic site) lyase, partial [Chloroflexota bacterium]|nr:bifunctional DNA-formamidopyrimidine glycosylase/DNA-(apurinic or apyrimidinic site) lyase [Chloroflexota bacterium]
MPELPEVQTVVNELGDRLVGRRFAPGAEILWERTIGYPDAGGFAERIAEHTVQGVRRRAKYILIDLDSAALLVVHLRMTGNLHFAAPGEPAHRHLRARFPLADGEELRFADMRKFGRIYLGREEDLATVLPLARLGPEPLADGFTPELLRAALARRRGPIKSVLLDQTVVAGLGNIYVDEALFRAGIDPRRPAESLADGELAALHAGIQETLRQAIGNGGTSFRDYLSTWGRKGANQDALLVFRRQGESCPRCGQPLLRIVVGGRGTHFCRACQR